MNRDWTYTLWPKIMLLWLLSFLVPELVAFRTKPEDDPERVRKTYSRALERWCGVRERAPRRFVIYGGLFAALGGLIWHVETQPPLPA